MYKVLNDIQLTRNFSLSEFECHDGSHEVMLDMQLVLKLQVLRDAIEQPITVAAGYRNPTHNADVGGQPDSLHLEGKAADIKVTGRPPKAIAVIADNIGFKGIGVYTHNGNSFVHLDVRPTKRIWRDQPGKTLVDVKSVKDIPD